MSIPADCVTIRLEAGGKKLNVPTGSEVENAGTQTMSGTISVASGGTLAIASGGTLAIASGGALTGKQVRHRVRTAVQDVDNGAGTTVDHVVLNPAVAITVVAAAIVYTEEVAGTVAAATCKLGKAVGGEEIVAAATLTNSAVVGARQALTLVTPAGVAVAAGTPICWRHTGIAATAAGKVFLEIDYTIDA